jgi:hypothetical protein
MELGGLHGKYFARDKNNSCRYHSLYVDIQYSTFNIKSPTPPG